MIKSGIFDQKSSNLVSLNRGGRKHQTVTKCTWTLSLPLICKFDEILNFEVRIGICFLFLTDKINVWLVQQKTVDRSNSLFLSFKLVLRTPWHRGWICQFSSRWIHYVHFSQSTGRKTGRSHLCAWCFF